MKKVILITGASSGIGKACAVAAAEKQWIVYAGHRKESDAEMLSKLHDGIRPIKLDVLNESQRIEAKNLIHKEHGRLDCLFNNAGIANSGTIEFLSLDKFRKQIEINFIGPVAMTQLFIPLLRESSVPRILFTGSAAGILAKPMMSSYSASKFALESFVDALRLELAPWNFKVSIFEPGKIKTEIYRKTKEELDRDQLNISPEEVSLYSDLLDVARYNIEHADEQSSEVGEVVEVFIHALESKNPKARYAVGGDAKMQSLIAKLPDRIRDWFIKTKINKIQRNLKKT